MTDRDRYAKVVDRRLLKRVYRLVNRAPDAHIAICDYIELREREAARDALAQTFVTADRLLQRQALLLLADHDPQIAQLEQRGRSSFPETRIVEAFRDAEQTGGDLAEAYAARELRWLISASVANDEVAHIVPYLDEIATKIVAELADRHREKFLGIPRATRPIKKAASDVTYEQIPFSQ
ncbi:MAG: hypothetical protein KGN02_01280 [bacterium]|nr:hypothetical protein [bacterium]